MFTTAFAVSGETQGRAFLGDAPPDCALFYGSHGKPVLHFDEAASTTFTDCVPLAGGANGNAGGVRGAGVPIQPGLHGHWGEMLWGDGLPMRIGHLCIYMGQRGDRW